MLADAHLSQEPGDEIAKDNGLVRLLVVLRRRNAGHIPEICLPFVHVAVCCLSVDKQYARCALDKPATVQNADSAIPHGLDRFREFRYGRLELFDLDGGLRLLAARQPTRRPVTYRLLVERPNERVPVAILGSSDRRF